MDQIFNELWKYREGRISIITPVYNRRKELPRALSSLEKQSYLDIEHIVINDGSVEPLDDIMEDYMRRAPYPVAYIKKNNGGVHTARNAGIKISRGELMAFLDSDDEYLPDFCEVFVEAWDSIPCQIRAEYRECNAYCVDQNGKRIGKHLPANINELSYKDAKSIADNARGGEKVGFFRADLMRSNPWPEPEGVKVVAESILWLKLGYLYKTWFLDDCLRIYHASAEDAITGAKNKCKPQSLINSLYNSLWFINNGRNYGMSNKKVFEYAIKHSVCKHLLRWQHEYPNYEWAKRGCVKFSDKLIQAVLWFPAIFLAILYKSDYKKIVKLRK